MEEYDLKKEHIIKPSEQNHGSKYIYIDFVYNLSWMLAFWIMVENTSTMNCSNPVWFWGNFAKYFYLVNTLINLACLFFLTDLFIKRVRIELATMIIYLLVGSISRIAGIFLIFGVISSFINRDSCQDLKTLIIVQLVFISIIIIFVVCKSSQECFNFFFGSWDEDLDGKYSKARHKYSSILQIIFPYLERNKDRW